MAKKATTKKTTKKADVRDVALEAIKERAFAASGRRDAILASEAEYLLISLPLRYLCWRYLLVSDGFPLGRLVHIYGVEGSGKSALASDMARWHLELGGMGVVIETENKDIPDLRCSLLGDSQLGQRLLVQGAGSMEEWQRIQTAWVTAIDEYFTKASKSQEAAAARSIPYVIIVDAITASAAEDEAKKLAKDGAAGRGQFGLGANLLASYCRWLPGKLRDRPITVIWVNHGKPRMENNVLVTRTPGGQAIHLHASLELRVKRTKFIRQVRQGGITVRITCTKNAVGEANRTIEANLLWKKVIQDGQVYQTSLWDWHGASGKLLATLAAAGGADLKAELKKLLGLSVLAGGRVACQRLGVTRAAPITLHELGAAVEADPDLAREIDTLLGVARRPKYRPGVDFLTQVQDSLKEGANVARQRAKQARLLDIGAQLDAMSAGTRADQLNEEPEGTVDDAE